MAYLRLNFRSEALGKNVDISVVLPLEAYTCFEKDAVRKPRISHGENTKPVLSPGKRFPTIYLIHGGGDDDTAPYRYTNAETYAQERGVMLVTPDVSNSFGANTDYGVDYELFITYELPNLIRSIFPSSDKREDNFIMGFAMGGNVALSCAIRHPEMYAACVDMSGGIGYTLDTEGIKSELLGDHFKNHFYLFNATFGTAECFDESEHNLYTIAKEKKLQAESLPQYYIVCGSEEGFIRDRVEKDVAKLQELEYPVVYDCVPGGKHDMKLWDAAIRDMILERLPINSELKKG